MKSPWGRSHVIVFTAQDELSGACWAARWSRLEREDAPIVEAALADARFGCDSHAAPPCHERQAGVIVGVGPGAESRRHRRSRTVRSGALRRGNAQAPASPQTGSRSSTNLSSNSRLWSRPMMSLMNSASTPLSIRRIRWLLRAPRVSDLSVGRSEVGAVREAERREVVLLDRLESGLALPAFAVRHLDADAIGRIVALEPFGIRPLVPGGRLEHAILPEACVQVAEIHARKRVVDVGIRDCRSLR